MSNSSAEINLAVLTSTRRVLHRATKDLSRRALTEIPDGFNNNILWNVGHLVVTQQILCYQLSGLPMGVDDDIVEMFRKGSSPKEWQGAPDYAELVEPLHGLVDTTAKDYAAGRFEGFNAYTTSAGNVLESIEDAIAYNNFHEGIHFGYILALLRVLADDS